MITVAIDVYDRRVIFTDRARGLRWRVSDWTYNQTSRIMSLEIGQKRAEAVRRKWLLGHPRPEAS